MIAGNPGQALDALLDAYSPPPPAPDLAARIAAIAVTHPQKNLAGSRWMPRDRRGGWFRRPLIISAAALGLAFSGAVASSYAGVELPMPMRAVVEKLPFVNRKAPSAPPASPSAQAQSRPMPRSHPGALASDAQQVHERPLFAFWRSLTPWQRERLRRAPPARRLFVAKQIVDARRAAGLATPRADLIERMIERRRENMATRPIAQQIRQIRREERRAERRARLDAAIDSRREVPTEPALPNTDSAVRTLPAAEQDMGRGEQLRAVRIERRRALREERLRRRIERRERLRGEDSYAPDSDRGNVPAPSSPNEGREQE